MNDALAIALPLIQRFEGLRLRPYLCPADIPTIGWGSTRYLNGRRVALTDAAISKEAADRLLLLTVERDYLPAVKSLCPGADTDGRIAALVSFAYNLGARRLQGSTLRRKVNENDWLAVPGQ